MKFRVRELARAQQMTAEDLARQAGLRYSAVKNLWQNRTPNPKYGTLRAIARALGVSVEQLEAPDGESVGKFWLVPASA
jgi:transcriptional regulator with XRE-family HTH domain